MPRLTTKDKANIKNFQERLPHKVRVHVNRSEDGGFVAEVLSVPGHLITEGDTFSELIGMVNDAVLTAFDIPEKYRSYLPTYLPPLNVAANLSLFSHREKDEQVTLQLAVNGGATR